MPTGQTGLPPNQPTSLKVKNVQIFGIFQPIWLKLGMQSLNGRTQHMNLIYKDFSMLTGLPASQPTTLKVINVQQARFAVFQAEHEKNKPFSKSKEYNISIDHCEGNPLLYMNSPLEFVSMVKYPCKLTGLTKLGGKK